MGFTTVESSAAWAAVLLAIATVVFKMVFKEEWKNLPPGPKGLPIIGYLHKLCSKPIHYIMNELSEQYGDVFCMSLGSRLTLVLNSREAIYEALIKKAKSFSGRPDLATFNKTRHGCVGISMCDYSPAYKQNRQMTVKAMHSLCSDGTFLKQVFTEETEKMVGLFNELAYNNVVFNPMEEFYKIIPGIVVNFIFGRNLSYTDHDLLQLVNFNRRWFESAESNNPADFFKILERFPNERLKAIENSGAAFYGYILQRMVEHEEGRTCLLQSYLDLYRKHLCRETFTTEEKLELARVVADMLGGAFDTVALTLSWGLLYLADKPDVINKCRKELNDVFQKKAVSYDEHKQLPYFCATIYDILRLSSVAPMGLPRSTTENIKFRNYFIPKDTMVFPNLWEVNRDKTVWTKPGELYPENFLTTNGEIDYKAVRKLATFSFGVRKCPGEKLALMEMFNFLGTFLKRFNFEIIEPPQNMEPSHGLTSQPKKYTITVTKIEENNNI